MKHTIQTDIIIIATEKEVWEVLTDFKSYPDWNPFMKSISGDLKEGEILTVEILYDGDKKPSKYKPKLQSIHDKQHLSWFGKLPIPGLFEGRHIFEIQAHPSGVRFSQFPCATFRSQ